MAVETSETALPEVQEATRDEGQAVLDNAAWRLLGMTGAEFLAAWDGGEFVEETERHEVSAVASLMPFAR